MQLHHDFIARRLQVKYIFKKVVKPNNLKWNMATLVSFEEMQTYYKEHPQVYTKPISSL